MMRGMIVSDYDTSISAARSMPSSFTLGRVLITSASEDPELHPPTPSPRAHDTNLSKWGKIRTSLKSIHDMTIQSPELPHKRSEAHHSMHNRMRETILKYKMGHS